MHKWLGNKRFLISQYLERLVPMVCTWILPLSLLKYSQNRIIYEPRIKNLGIEIRQIPLFSAVHFEVRSKCNGTCSFCAASVQNESRPDTSMPKSMYVKVIDELKYLGYTGRIAYHVNNDPLIFPDLPEFVEYARNSFPSNYIDILTNGRALSEKKAANLLEAGINELSINDYNDDLNAETPKNIQRVYDKVLPRFYERHQIRTGHGPDVQGRTIFRFNIYRSKATIVKRSRAGTAPNKQLKSNSIYGFCEYPFWQINIATDGRVSKCCNDLYFSDPMGNVNNDCLMDIWKGKRFEKIRELLLEGNRNDIETCRKCDFYGVRRYYTNAAKILHRITE